MKSIATFDVDWTLIKPKDGRTFPKNKDDWQWYRPSVPTILKRYYEEGYQIIFLTDQTKLWKKEMIENIIEELNLDIILIISMDKNTHKPNPQLFLENIKFKFSKKYSFYVGDAGGRVGDWSSVDKDVALELGLPYYCPEEIFDDPVNMVMEEIQIKYKEELEVIIMVGYPGSGKSTVCDSFPQQYKVISGDVFKTIPKMIKEAKKYVDNYSIIFDATNGTIDKRRQYIDFADEYHLPVRCIWINMDIELAIERIQERVFKGGNHVPKIALYTFRKRFEEPMNDVNMELLRFDVT
jgi:bifunctional polynucleotide phosphatase/kinase